jgi:hypothetical protein
MKHVTCQNDNNKRCSRWNVKGYENLLTYVHADHNNAQNGCTKNTDLKSRPIHFLRRTRFLFLSFQVAFDVTEIVYY